MRAPQRRAVGR